MTTPTNDAILKPSTSRFILYPIKYPEIWDAYKTAQASFWTADEIDLSADVRHWTCRLTDEERAFISILLAFFAASDGMVNENLLERFCAEVQIPEARCFYGFQIMMENIHAETYASMLTTLIQDNAERDRLFSATSTIPAIKAKAEWTMRWIEDKHQPFAVRLIAFAAVEGIFFSSSFAAIFWLRSRGLLPGICHSNELIARDESMHTMFACLLYSQLQTRAPKATVRAVIREAVALEKSFFADALPTRLAGMNTELMGDYVEAVADDLLRRLGCRPIYDKENPFPFITSSALDGRTNFFERRVSEYSAVSHMHSNAINADLDRPPRESDL
ncbi:putative ribonucleoside-diphosphate reductase small chain B [Trametes versicolor FP-101664 SS1]|uniref:Putative ribonucleoside-diphosphate reductase small chain B n=1 Tax=Trametes versicolor (strain FP-101664) TaxID=717944 RepID=R7S732_TRAVS|nr:putative ribonucleoside-diphosphate reductase small chain B [Trametes versicolor FP-101664 SS1]EIW51392.1 putative ribonucleoside-diphosphate reductase small chain B [Trametes versicolor FP-101664 SS1]